MRIKGWNKLILQVIGVFIVMMLSSVFYDSNFYNEYFLGTRKMLNYRGWIMLVFNFVFVVIAVIRVVTSHKEEDF